MTVVILGKLRSETIVNSIDYTGFSCPGADSALTACRPGYDQWIKRNRGINKINHFLLRSGHCCCGSRFSIHGVENYCRMKDVSCR
jgi:hypothetical protein